MKKLLLLLLGLSTALGACKKDTFLEPQTNALTEETVFGDSIRTMGFLSRTYQDMGFTFQKGRWSSHGNSEHATDDAEYFFSGAAQVAVQLYSGSFTASTFYGTQNNLTNANNNGSDFWLVPWQNIRRCNLLLSKLSDTPLTPRMRARVAAEARFLRVWYYDQLLKTFGGVPLIQDKVYDITDVINSPRSSYADCVTYLVAELDDLATKLPNADGSNPNAGLTGYAAADYGRVTRGAALALKSRILLFAASPLFNGGADSRADAEQRTIVSYPTVDPNRWQLAANAAKAVLDLGQYGLIEDNATKPGFGFYSSFLRRYPNQEHILTYERLANRDMEAFYFPSSRGGNRYSMPTQNIVDAFPMRNGRAITDPTSGYNAANPYVNRDPRFNNTIIYNGSRVFRAADNAVTAVYTYVGAPTDGFDATTFPTGYYCRKMCDTATTANQERGWPLIRYGEIVLNYAEALNEVGNTSAAIDQLITLRRRAGILAGTDGRYGIRSGLAQADARELIRNERRIELAYEDHRWHDIRRWKIAEQVNNGFNGRMSIRLVSGTPTATGPGNAVWSYTVVPSLRKHNFRPEMYLLPIPDTEIRKVPLFRQNPGW